MTGINNPASPAPETILLVDDHQDNLIVMKKVLQKALPHADIVTIQKPEEVMSYLRVADVSVVISDLQMPVLNGIDLCRLIKTDDETGHIPVLLVTSHQASPGFKANGLDAGADDFLTRPMDNDELVARVKAALRISRAEAQLRRTADRVQQDYRLLFDSMLSAFAVHEVIFDDGGKPMDYRFLNVNPAFETHTTLRPKEVLGKTAREVFPNLDPKWIESYEMMVSTGKPVHFEHYSPDLERHLEGDVFLTGKNRFAASFTDVTEHKQAEEVLVKTEAKQAKMVANIGDVIVIIDQDGINRYKSPNISKWFGWEPEDLVGSGTLDNVHPDDVDRAQELIGDLMSEAKKTGTIEFRYRCKDGAYKWIEFTGINLLHDSDIKGILGNYQDITERKVAEKEQEELHAQLVQAQKMESVGRLAGGVAHDFNNMLGVIIGRSYMIMEKLDPSLPLYEEIKMIESAAQRSADLTRQLLAFARKQTAEPKVLDLNETLKEMLQMLQRLIGEDIDLAWIPGENLGLVNVDPSQIDQMLANLCINAQDAIAGVGKITIETTNVLVEKDYCSKHVGSIPGEFVMLTVSDDGHGMDAETLAQVFEPFFTTKEVGKGTGLGLSTIYGVAKQNGGFIDVQSEQGQGTRFKIYLPRYTGNPDQLRAQDPEQPLVRGHETVLLVEDEPTILEMLTEVLEDLGYTVLGASTPGEAIRLAQKNVGQINLLITDVVMPEMNGRDLAEIILSHHPNIKRLFMSGYTADVIANQGVLEQDLNFIQKPFTIENLGAKVREVMSGK